MMKRKMNVEYYGRCNEMNRDESRKHFMNKSEYKHISIQQKVIINIVEMLTISEDTQYLQTHVRAINQPLTSLSQSLTLFIHQLQASLPSLHNLQAILSSLNSIDSQHLSALLTALLTQYTNPQIQISENKQDLETILTIIHKLLSLPHDRQQLIKNLKDQSQKSDKGIDSKKVKKSLQKIDAEFVLLLCWLFGKKQENINLVELIIDTFAFSLMIDRKSRGKNQILENWRLYIDKCDQRKKMRLRIRGRIQSSQIIGQKSKENFPTHIYIPL